MSAAQFTILGINAAKPFLDNSEYWKDKGRETVERIRRKSTNKAFDDDPRDMDHDRRSRARPRGGFIADRSKSAGDNSDYSSDEDYYRGRRDRSRGGRRQNEYRNYDAYESEGSVPPRNRGAMIRRSDTNGSANNNNNNNNVAPYAGAGAGAGAGADAVTRGTKSERGRDDTDSDSSSVISSSEDEHQEKKKQREKLITGGMATVATLNAAVNVYSSMKMRDERHKALAEGRITKEEAKKQRLKLHLQDAAAIGVSAICVKGAYAKWMQVTEKNREHRNHKQERMERREKRDRQESRRRMREAEGDDDDAPPPYANGGGVNPQQRPVYNRGYSRSLNDVRNDYAPQYHNSSYQRKQREAAKRRQRYDYRGYDDGGAFDGGDAGGE